MASAGIFQPATFEHIRGYIPLYYLILIPSLTINHTGLSIEKLANPSDMSYCVLMSPARLGASLKINEIVSLHKLPQWFSSAPGFRGKQKQLWRTALENRVFPKKVNCLVVWNRFFFPIILGMEKYPN
jgi:hypothetical protein